MFREHYHGPYLTKPELIDGIVRMLGREGVAAVKTWFESVDPRILFGAYMGLSKGRRTRNLERILRDHSVRERSSAEPNGLSLQTSARRYPPGTMWTFVHATDSFTRPYRCMGRTVGEAAMVCAHALKLHPGSPDEALMMLGAEGIRIPDSPSR